MTNPVIHFVSDLHLSDARPALTGLFLRYLAGPAREAGALWILGDLFEYWAGDDDLDDPLHRDVCAALRALADAGTKIRLVRGNRDFLIGTAFAAAAGLELRDEPAQLRLGADAALLVHGDAECTDDVAYQAFRRQVRDPAWQAGFVAQPLAVRKQIIAGVRMQSEASKQHKAADIMDVNPDAIAGLLRANAHPALLIHGHTHRPAEHAHTVDGRRTLRWVLADWSDERGEALVWDGERLSRRPLH